MHQFCFFMALCDEKVFFIFVKLILVEGKAKAKPQTRNQRPVNPNKRTDKGPGNRTAGDSIPKADKNPKKKWSWQGNK